MNQRSTPAPSPSVIVPVTGPSDDDISWDLVIRHGRRERTYWRDVWRYRELFQVLAWRDLSVRYKQTVVGFGWAVVQPLVSMLVMTVVFGMVSRLPSEHGAPYAVMVFAGLLPWQLFATSLTSSAQSVVANANLISKVYFPRIIIPLSSLGVAAVDFAVSCVVLGGLMAWHGMVPGWPILTLPLLLAIAMATAIGPGLIITALTVKFRDFRILVPFLVQVGLYLSPVAYSASLVRERFGDVAYACYCINPMVTVIEGFRWAVLGGSNRLDWFGVLVSAASAAVMCVVGVRFFRRTERHFADLI